jgi:hypothetical protein
MGIAVFVFSFSAPAQEPKECSKAKIYVRVAFVQGVEGQFYEDYPTKFPKNEKSDRQWLSEISSYVVEQIRLRAAEVEVIPLEQAIFIDDMPETPKEENSFNENIQGEYHLDFILSLITSRNDCGVRDPSLHPSYLACGDIGDADIDGVYVGVDLFEHPDLYAVIRSDIELLSKRGFQWLLERYELTHFHSLRDPTMKLKVLDPGFVSPLPEEQKVKVEVATEDCRGRFGEGTNLWFPVKPERGQTVASKESEVWNLGENWKARTVRDGKIEIEYSLIRGDDTNKTAIDVEIIGRGQKKIRQVVFIPVKTLQVEVEPERKQVAPGDQTRVFVRLFKVDDTGTREPVNGRTLEIKATGLEDGRLEPQDKVTIDESGVGTLTYTAGARDRAVKIEASYKPENYETTFRGEGLLNAGAYTVTVDLEASQSYVPDGGMYIAALGMHAAFGEVRFHEGQTHNILAALVPIARGKGEFTKFLLHDIEPNKVGSGKADREAPRFTKGPPKAFTVQLKMAMDTEDVKRRALGKRVVPPSKTPAPMRTTAKLIFEYLGLMDTEWQSSVGSATLDGLYLEFDAPWADLLAGKPVTLKVPCKGGDFDKGTWTITFAPKSAKQ